MALLSLVLLLHHDLVAALPFVTVWNTTTANEVIYWPTIFPETSLTVEWGDTTGQYVAANTAINLTHTYSAAGPHTISVTGRLRWLSSMSNPSPSRLALKEISAWGDGFIIDPNFPSTLFQSYSYLQVTAPANTQPVFLPGASLRYMFGYTAFNSPLDWDLTNVTDIEGMFAGTFYQNSRITFSNTQSVTTFAYLFANCYYFNQPINFDATSATSFAHMFEYAWEFNQPVTLTNSLQVTTASSMFIDNYAFNQPITFRTDSVTDMTNMFAGARSFNQPISFSVAKLETSTAMFANAWSFNQPINFQSPNLFSTGSMFQNATKFNSPVTMNTPQVVYTGRMFADARSFASTVTFTSTGKVTSMWYMFDNADAFDQNLIGWDTSNVTNCFPFCAFCGLPTFPRCTPCVQRYTDWRGLSVCSNTTRAPTTAAPTTAAPSLAPTTAAPSLAPTPEPTPGPTPGPTTSSPTTAMPTTETPTETPTLAPTLGVTVSSALAVVPSIALLAGFRFFF